MRCLPARRPRSTNSESDTPYFDGCLPIEVMAERGRETLRHGPMKPFGLTNPHQPQTKALRGGATAPGQQARHAVQHGRLSDQAPTRRAGSHFPDNPRPRQRRVRPARRPAPQHLSQFAEAARCDAAAESDAAFAFCRSDHRLRGLCGSRRRSGCWPAALPPPSGSANRCCSAADHGASAPCSATSPAAISRGIERVRAHSSR